MSMSFFTDELAEVKTHKKAFLGQMNQLIPWSEWVAMIRPCYYKGERGNKPYGLELMLRIYVLQMVYNVADMAVAAEVIDSRAFSEFCGVTSSNQVPNGDTIGRFRNILIQNRLQEKLFADIVSRLKARGLMLMKGTIVDSTLIAALLPPRMRRKSGIRMRIRSRRAISGTSATRVTSPSTGIPAWSGRLKPPQPMSTTSPRWPV